MTLEQMLDAHVAFEVDRLTGPDLERDLHALVTDTLEWLDGQPLGAVLPAAEVAALARRAAADLPASPDLAEYLADLAGDVQQELADRHAVVGDLVDRADVDALVEVIAPMEGLRSELLDIVVGSPAYTRLVAHVLYHGVKSYVLTENVFARKIPGASSLVRLGQRGLTTAAPRLEASVDRQLTAFVEANITDTLRESQRYLQATVDASTLAELAGQTWEAVADRPVPADTPSTAQQRVALAEVGRQVMGRWQQTGLLPRLVGSAVEAGLNRHADRMVGDLLAELGVDRDALASDLAALVRPGLEQARVTGLLQRQVRARLEPFYRSWEQRTDA